MIKFLLLSISVIFIPLASSTNAQIYDPEGDGIDRQKHLQRNAHTPAIIINIRHSIEQELIAGDVQGALKIFDTLDFDRINDRDKGWLFMLRASIFEEVGNISMALHYRVEALKIGMLTASSERHLLYLIANNYLLLNDYENTIRYLNQRLAFTENDSENTYFALAKAYKYIGEIDLAKEYLRRTKLAWGRVNSSPFIWSSEITLEEILNLEKEILDTSYEDNAGRLLEKFWPIYEVVPSYEGLNEIGETSKATLIFDLNKYGRPLNIRILESSDRSLEAPALEAMKQYKFVLSKKPQADIFLTDAIYQINFRAKDKDKAPGTIIRR